MKKLLLLFILLFSGFGVLAEDFVYIKNNQIYGFDIAKKQSKRMTPEKDYQFCEYTQDKHHIVFRTTNDKSGYVDLAKGTRKLIKNDIDKKAGSSDLMIDPQKNIYSIVFALKVKGEEEERTKIRIYSLKDDKVLKEFDGFDPFWDKDFNKMLFVAHEHQGEKWYIKEYDRQNDKLVVKYENEKGYPLGVYNPIYIKDRIYFNAVGEDSTFFVKLTSSSEYDTDIIPIPEESKEGLYGICHASPMPVISNDGKKALIDEWTVDWAQLKKPIPNGRVLLFDGDNGQVKIVINSDATNYCWLPDSNEIILYTMKNNIYMLNINDKTTELLIENASLWRSE